MVEVNLIFNTVISEKRMGLKSPVYLIQNGMHVDEQSVTMSADLQGMRSSPAALMFQCFFATLSL